MNDSSNYKKADLETAIVTLDRGVCFGPCPNYKLVVEGNGKVLYHGRGYVKVIGARRSFIPTDAATTLVQTMLDYNFHDFYRYYAREDCWMTDCAFITVELKIGNVEKSVTRIAMPPISPDQPFVPEKLLFLENEIDRVTNSIQWVGLPEERRR